MLGQVPKLSLAQRVVLVEDNPDDAELTLEALADYQLPNPVMVLSDGQQALDYLQGQGRFADRQPDLPDLVLLDLKLPLVDGIEVLRRIKSDPRLCSIPVVVMTSSREEADLADVYRLGANSYVVKPVDFTHLIETVRLIGNYWLTLNERAPVR